MAKSRRVIDLRIPFFRPVWRRIALLVVLGAWIAFELIWGNPWWALLAGGITVYAIREFFVATTEADFEDRSGGDDGPVA